MDWLESGGGPLLLMPSRTLHGWRGVARSSLSPLTDYERACAVDDYLGLISVGDAHALVLGDEPLRTAWLAHGDTGMLVRWVYADSEAAVRDAARWESASAVSKDSGVRIHVDGPLLVIDAADPGDDLKSGSLAVRVQPGAYRVDSGFLDAGEVRLLVHQFVRC